MNPWGREMGSRWQLQLLSGGGNSLEAAGWTPCWYQRLWAQCSHLWWKFHQGTYVFAWPGALFKVGKLDWISFTWAKGYSSQLWTRWYYHPQVTIHLPCCGEVGAWALCCRAEMHTWEGLLGSLHTWGSCKETGWKEKKLAHWVKPSIMGCVSEI